MMPRYPKVCATRAATAGLLLFLANPQAGSTANYEEAHVRSYTLPDALRLANGKPGTTTNLWLQQRRPELLELFRTQVYGRSPQGPIRIRSETRSVQSNALDGLAICKQVDLGLDHSGRGVTLHLLLLVPRSALNPPPVFLGLNFGGNHTVCADPCIQITPQMHRERSTGVVDQRLPPESERGEDAGEWQVERMLRRGYALATLWYGDIEPDFPGGWPYGVRGAWGREGTNTVFAPEDWGALSAWAWGLSRALDYLESDSLVDARRVVVMGHSRLGKAALWAGAQDERFAAVISNNSGCGGAALSRRLFGETIADINTSFPHWFAGNFKKYNHREADLPVDQHELIALIAPRSVYVASAEKDLWADPRGEFLAAQAAGPVYELFGRAGVGADSPPPLNQPTGDVLRYHIRSGWHDVTAYDWEQFLDFADRHLVSATSKDRAGSP